MLIFYLCLSFFIARKRQSFDYFGSLNYYNNCNKTHDIALKSTNSIGYTYKYICHPCFVDKKIFFFVHEARKRIVLVLRVDSAR